MSGRLLCITGLTPQVVTETLYALATEPVARLTLLSEEPGWFVRLCRDYELSPIRFDADGLQVLTGRDGAPLLEREGLPPERARLLRQAAFYERTTNPVKAREKLTSVAPDIERLASPLGGLFQPELTARLGWRRKERPDMRELCLADAALERRDYLRDAVFLLEAYLTRCAYEQKEDCRDYAVRDRIRKECHAAGGAFRQLARLRNAMVHGVKDDDRETLRLLGDEDSLRTALWALRQALFGRD